MRRLLAPALLATAALFPGAAHADEPLAPITGDVQPAAYGGVVAFFEDGGLKVRIGDSAIAAPPIHASTPALDVGPDAQGRPTVVWRSGRSVRAYRPGTAVRTIATLPRGASQPALSGSRLAYAQAGGGCSTPMLRDLRTGRTRRLDRGRCGSIERLDLSATRVATLVELTDGRTTEARVIRTAGGPSRRIQRETQGEESNYIGGIALDGDKLITARAGFRQENVLTRFDLRTGRREDARAFVDLLGGIAASAGRLTYTTTLTNSDESACSTGQCAIVAGPLPWGAAERLLPAQLTIAHEGDQYVDQDAVITGRLFRKRVSRVAELGREPVAGSSISLIERTGFLSADQTVRDTGRRATTGPDGTWSITIPAAELGTQLRFGARTTGNAVTVVGADDEISQPVFARLTMTGEQQADGSIRFRGTVTPALAGRKVRIDRRLDDQCAHMQPPTTGDACPIYTQDPLATGTLSPDGGAFELTVPAAKARAGTYRAQLDFLRDRPEGRQGRSNTVTVAGS